MDPKIGALYLAQRGRKVQISSSGPVKTFTQTDVNGGNDRTISFFVPAHIAQFDRALDMNSQGCGFNARAGQPNKY